MALGDCAMVVIISVPQLGYDKTRTLTKYADETWDTYRKHVDEALQVFVEAINE